MRLKMQVWPQPLSLSLSPTHRSDTACHSQRNPHSDVEWAGAKLAFFFHDVILLAIFQNIMVIKAKMRPYSPVVISRKNRRYCLKTKRLREGWSLNLKTALLFKYNRRFLRLMRPRLHETRVNESAKIFFHFGLLFTRKRWKRWLWKNLKTLSKVEKFENDIVFGDSGLV